MSRHAWIGEAAIKDKRLGNATYRVYSLLLTYVRNGRAFPKTSTIARELGLARSTVSEHLHAAARLGYLIIEPTVRQDGGCGHNLYRVLDEAEPPVGVLDGPPVGPDPTAPVGPDPTAPVGPDPTAPVGPDPTAIENKAIEHSSPSGRRARAREAGISQSPSRTGRQPALLLPINGAVDAVGEGGASGAIESYQPDADVVAWAAEHAPGVDALDPNIVGSFRDYHASRGTRLQDVNAAYRNWLRREKPPPPASEPSSRRGHARRGRAADLLGGTSHVVIDGEWAKWSG
jgi:hypothetical protein